MCCCLKLATNHTAPLSFFFNLARIVKKLKLVRDIVRTVKIGVKTLCATVTLLEIGALCKYSFKTPFILRFFFRTYENIASNRKKGTFFALLIGTFLNRKKGTFFALLKRSLQTEKRYFFNAL